MRVGDGCVDKTATFMRKKTRKEIYRSKAKQIDGLQEVY